MAAKKGKAKRSPQQQRELRSRIMLAVLGVVFVGVLALQLPKLMGGSGGGSPQAAAGTTTPAGSTTPASAATGYATPVGTVAPQGTLVRFSRFAPKDPFNAQVSVNAGAAAGASTGTAPPPATPTPKKPATPSLTFSVQQTAAKPTGPLVPAALLRLNDKRSIVALGGTFPAKNPLFRLVALSQKAIWVQLVGGSLSNGARTLKILRGRPVKLANTTDGTRFLLLLVRPTTTSPPAPPAPNGSAPAATTAK